MGKNNSFEKINYSLRPAKSIERKIITQFCTRLNSFDFVENYHYIGFGSIYYTDFILFHKLLHIHKMSSIEYERNESRARFNLPFSCISLYPGTSNQILSTILLKEEKNITWLDYDSPISSAALDDVQTYIGKICSGNLLMLTFNANSDENPSLKGDLSALFEYRIQMLKERISEQKMPTITKEIELNKKNLHKVYQKIILNEINDNLIKYNKTLDYNLKISFKQVMHFTYSDDAKMMTIGFVFFTNNNKEKFDNCKFNKMTYFSEDDNAHDLVAPKLTNEEIRTLNKILPLKDNIDYEITDIKNSEFNKAKDEYSKVYKYFPQFSESLY